MNLYTYMSYISYMSDSDDIQHRGVMKGPIDYRLGSIPRVECVARSHGAQVERLVLITDSLTWIY